MSTINTKRRIAYFYNDDIGNINYGTEHPMKPKRITMTNELLVSYNIYRHLEVYRPHYATQAEMNLFHDLDYLKFLEISANKMNSFGNEISTIEKERLLNDSKKQQTFKIGLTTDCPIFNGLYDFCQISAGASLDSAILLAENEADICINWAGGLHHAKKQEASGFCYVNDIVIAIIMLLQYYQRVLYIDIGIFQKKYFKDVHHGDGVEEAFYCTNRVMTLSLHQYGEGFFPGSGGLDSVGQDLGKNYSINVPLKAGINDEQYTYIFKNVFNQVLDYYKPSIIVLQCGADSINSDQLGNFNLSTHAHGECVNMVLNVGLPTMLLGGGGYTIENVARCWTNETAIALNQPLNDEIPIIDKYLEQYKNGEFKLHIESNPDMKNENSYQDLHNIQETISYYLKDLNQAPSVQFYEKIDFNRDYQQIQYELSEDEYDALANVGKGIIDKHYTDKPIKTQNKSDFMF